MNPRRWLPLLLAAASAPLPAQENTLAVGAELSVADDSERFTTRRASVVAPLKDFRHLDNMSGLRYGQVNYTQDHWSRSGQQLGVFHHRMDTRTWSGWMMNAGVLQQGGRDAVTLDASYRRALSAQSGVEVFVNRDVVETRTALDQGRAFNFAGISGDAGLSPHWTVTGMLGHQSFNDGNDRRHVRGRLIYQPDLDLGLTLQLRYRYVDASQADVGRAYFNPERYDEGMLAIGLRNRVRRWKTHLVAGAGRQRINDDGQTPTQLFEASAERQQNDYALRLRLSHTRSAAFGGPDYRRTAASVEFVVSF